MAIALARRYRPRRFSELIVQDHVAAVLRGAVAKGRVGHGYLLTGPRGVGKTTAARILAMALNCERKGAVEPAGEPCGECVNCSRIWSGAANLDVVEIDAASNRGVDDARDLRERAMYAASEPGHFKVYIVDEAHMLTREAWNALLKILEEPPPGVVFVFATTEPQKISQTAAPVMSRLQRFDFRRIGPTAIRERLHQVLDAEQIAFEDDALTVIARHADGGMRDALSVLDQCLSFGEERLTAAGVRDILGLADDALYGDLLALVADRRPAEVFALVDRVQEAGGDLAEFMNGAAEALRALLMLQVGAEPEGLTEAMRQRLEEHRDRLDAGDLLRMLKLLADQEMAIRRSASPRLAVETLLLRWAMMDRTVDLAQVLSNPGPGAAVPSSPAPSRPTPQAPRSPPVMRSPPAPRAADSAPAGAASPPKAAAPVPATRIPFTREALTAAWPEISEAVRAVSPFLGEAVGAALPSAVDPPAVILHLSEDNPVVVDRLQRQRESIERVLAERVGQAVKLTVTAGSAQPPAEAAPRPKRMSDASARAERLRAVRGKDPALDLAADELDLEIVDGA